MPRLKSFEVEKYSQSEDYTKRKNNRNKIREGNNNNPYKKNDKSRRSSNYK